MPIVPRYGERQVGLAALPGARKTAGETEASTGVGVERAKQQTGLAIAEFGGQIARIGAENVARIVHEERQRADEVFGLNLENQLDAWENPRLYDPQTGALAQKGEAANVLPEQVNGEFKKLTGDLAGTASNDRQRAIAAKLFANRAARLDITLRRHVFTEMQTYEADEVKAYVANRTNAAVANAMDPARVGEELTKAIEKVRTHGPRAGLSPEAVEAQVRAVKTETHVGVIYNLLAQQQPKAATVYFEAATDQIDGDKLDDVRTALTEGTETVEAQKIADRILREGGTLTEQRAKAAAYEGELRDKVERRLEHDRTIADREQDEATKESMRVGYDIIDKTGDPTKIPPAQWAGFEGSTRSAMWSYATQRAAGKPIKTDWAVYNRLMRQAADDPDGFASSKTNLMAYRHLLDDVEFKQLNGVQLSIASGNRDAAEKDLALFRTKTDILDGTLGLYGIDPKAKPGTPDGNAVAHVQRQLDLAIEAAQAPDVAGKRKKLTGNEIQEKLDFILGQSETVPGSFKAIYRPFTYDWSDQTKRVVDFTIADVPPGMRPQIEEALRRAGTPVNDKTVLDLYISHDLRIRRLGPSIGPRPAGR